MLTKFINLERLIHSFKTCIACIIGFGVTRLIDFPADQWIVITIIVVMCSQIYVGSVIQKSYLRFLGTLIGCLFAALMLISYGHTTWTIATTIGIAGFVFSYIATGQETFAYAGTLGAVTTSIIMLGDNPNVTFAAERFLEISLGIFIATIVSQFVLPIHARTHLRRAQAATLAQLREYYEKVISSLRNKEETINYLNMDEAIVKTLLKQRQLAKESVREPLGKSFNRDHFTQTLHYEKAILRAVIFMHAALVKTVNAEEIFISSETGKAFNKAVLKSLDALKTAIQSNKSTKEPIQFPALTTLKNEIEQAASFQDERIYIDGFLFSASALLENLNNLAQLFDIPIKGIEASLPSGKE